MTDTTEIAAAEPASAGAVDLSTLRLPQLQAVASQLGISGTGRMRKSELLEAIRVRQSGGTPATSPTPVRSSRRAGAPAGAPSRSRAAAATAAEVPAEKPATASNGTAAAVEQAPAAPAPQADPAPAAVAAPSRTAPARTASSRTAPASAPAESNGTSAPAEAPAADLAEVTSATEREPRQRERSRNRGENRDRDTNRDSTSRDSTSRDTTRDTRDTTNRDSTNRDATRDTTSRDTTSRDGTRDTTSRESSRESSREFGRDTPREGQNGQNRAGQNRPQSQPAAANNAANALDDDEDGDGRGRRRRGRYRDRKRRGRDGVEPQGGDEPELLNEDDVVVPVAGILDVLDSYAFVRTSGYLPGPNDIYVSLGQVKKYGLRKGDAVTGAVRQPREGDQQNQRQKFNALVRLDTVNGTAPEEARARPEFGKLVPLYPQERLRLETDPGGVTNRVIDLVAPIGKGQRGLIVSPPKAGKTLVLQSIASAITRNNPECHLMVVLVDERPEEVTDMQRTVKGEVIASTFDRPADDHTTVAELAIERAKRLVELGHDVVVLLDSITRLGRAYNIAAPASGRILSGGVDSSALYPPKRFFGAARNIENGGSLTILATALIETGSKMDEVIFEEFKGTGNMELRLSRQLADKRIFPAVDVNASGTRREEILMGKDELNIIWKLRRVMGALEAQQAIELLLDRVKKSSSNAEFLMAVSKSTPVPGHDE